MKELTNQYWEHVFSVIVLLYISLFGSLYSADAQLPVRDVLPQITKDKIANLMVSSISQNVFPGAVVLVAKGENVFYRKAFGNRQILPRKIEMTDSTLFDIASMSKCIATAPSVMKLIEDGKIGLHDKVNKYIPRFKPWIYGKDTVDITIQQLLSHSSGLDAGLSTATVNRLRTKWGKYDTENLVNYIAFSSKRNFRPGTRSLYSCLNFIVLQGIVEKLTKMRLCDYATKQIFRPLGMKHSFYFLENDTNHLKYQIAATSYTSAGVPLIGEVHDPIARLLNGGNSGNAGVFTNVDDIARFCFSLFDKKRSILSESSIQLMCEKPKEDSPTVGRGLGWELNSSYAGSLKKHKCICHTGYTGTSIVIDLEAQVSIILLTNRVHPNDDANKKPQLMKVRRQLSDIVAYGLKI